MQEINARDLSYIINDKETKEMTGFGYEVTIERGAQKEKLELNFRKESDQCWRVNVERADGQKILSYYNFNVMKKAPTISFVIECGLNCIKLVLMEQISARNELLFRISDVLSEV